MRVSPISVNYCGQSKNNLKSRKANVSNRSLLEQPKDQLAFKGFGGKITGGLTGAGIAGLCALSALTPVGWLATLTFVAAEAGGALIGGAIGDKLTGKDEDEE